MSDDLTTAYMAGYHKRDDEVKRLREDLRLGMIKAGTMILEKDAEIEQLRKALRSSCDEQRQLFRDEANMPCEAAVDNEVLRGLLSEIWRHRNGGSALSSSWDRRVTEVLETNGPA